jgi:hypothetical protein
MLFQKDRDGELPAETRARYVRVIDAAAAEVDAIAASAAAWLRDEIKAGRLPKTVSGDQLRRVAHIIQTAVKSNGR